jgi:hypothetical protein
LTSRRRALAAAASAVAAMALAAAVVGRGCSVTAPGPDATVRSLLQAARAGDRKAVWRLLSPDTQERLERQARHATEQVASNTRYTALDMISIGSSEDVPPPSEIRVKWRQGDDAVVEVAGTAGKAELSLRRVNGRWRVHLPQAPASSGPPEIRPQ